MFTLGLFSNKRTALTFCSGFKFRMFHTSTQKEHWIFGSKDDLTMLRDNANKNYQGELNKYEKFSIFGANGVIRLFEILSTVLMAW